MFVAGVFIYGRSVFYVLNNTKIKHEKKKTECSTMIEPGLFST